MRTVSHLTPMRDYDSGGLHVQREWAVPPAFQAFVDVRMLQLGLIPMRELLSLTDENERRARETGRGVDDGQSL